MVSMSSGKLELGHRPQPGQGSAEGQAGDGDLGDGRITHPRWAELFVQTFGDAVSAAELAYVLADDEHARVALQLLA